MLLHEKKKKELKNKVLSNAENLYNKLYYIYKDKYNKEINSLDTKNKEKLDYKKLRLSDYQYLSEEEQEEKQKPTKDDLIALNKRIIDEEIDLNEEFRKSKIFYTTKAMFIFINKLSSHTGNIVKLQ